MWTNKLRRYVFILVLATLTIGVVGGFMFLRRSEEQVSHALLAEPAHRSAAVAWEADVPDVDLPLTNTNPGYVGAKACGECHAARLKEIRNTRHFRACWPVENGPMPEAFAQHPSITTPAIKDVRYQASKTGDAFHETIIRHTEDSSDVDTDYTCSLIYGSGGRADEVYFAWKGTQLWELPVSWLRSRKSWGVQGWARSHAHTGSVRSATTRCMECHNTWFEHVNGTENEYRPDSFMFGVSCERCHGPGREHVAYHQANPDIKTARAIVQPAGLSRERQLAVCGQCHSNVVYRRTPLFSFQPGDRLEDHFRTMERPGVEYDHVADQLN